MLLGLSDFNVDIFLKFDDSGIYVYYSDFETIPELAEIMPLGSFDDDGKILLTELPFIDRIKVGLLFMERDLYAEWNEHTKNTGIRIDRLYNQFKMIPEVVDRCQPYIDRCNGADDQKPADWCTLSIATDPIEKPDYCDGTQYCTTIVPVHEFYNTTVDPDKEPEKYYEDLYYFIIVYFNGIYRTVPDSVENYRTYDILTDINFDRNQYTMIKDIKEFFTREFIYFLKTPPGSLPFANDYGTDIKKVIQTKNLEIQRIKIQNEIDFFVGLFNNVWGGFVHIRDVHIEQQFSDVGGDSWLVSVFATVASERLTYRLEIE